MLASAEDAMRAFKQHWAISCVCIVNTPPPPPPGSLHSLPSNQDSLTQYQYNVGPMSQMGEPQIVGQHWISWRVWWYIIIHKSYINIHTSILPAWTSLTGHVCCIFWQIMLPTCYWLTFHPDRRQRPPPPPLLAVTCYVSWAAGSEERLQDISHHRRFAPQDVSHPSSRRFAPVAVTTCPILRRFAPLWDVSHPQKTFHPLCKTFRPLCETFRPLLRRFAPREDVSPPGKTFRPLSKLRHFEPLCETFRPHCHSGRENISTYHKTYYLDHRHHHNLLQTIIIFTNK